MYISKFNTEKINPGKVIFIDKGQTGTQKKVVKFTIEFHLENDQILHWFYEKEADRDAEFNQIGINPLEELIPDFQGLIKEIIPILEEYFKQVTFEMSLNRRNTPFTTDSEA